jgi:hypothetical protein
MLASYFRKLLFDTRRTGSVPTLPDICVAECRAFGFGQFTGSGIRWLPHGYVACVVRQSAHLLEPECPSGADVYRVCGEGGDLRSTMRAPHPHRLSGSQRPHPV